MSPYRVDARLSGRHPFELFTLYLAFLSGLPTVIGLAPRPGTINDALPHWMAVGWAICLTVGSATALAGIYWKARGTGLILEQLGLAATGLASIVYAATAMYDIGLAASTAAAIVGGFGISCLWRYKQLQDIIEEARGVSKGGGAIL